MGTINQAWYVANSERSYPLDDSATAIDDTGQRLRQDIITDLYLRFPSAAGRYAYFSAVATSPGIVTVTILAAPGPAVPSITDPMAPALQMIPLAAISLAQAGLAEGRCYPLQSLYPGAGGWIVFGAGIEQPGINSYRFSTPQQALIMPRCAQAYMPLPVTSLGKLNNAQALQGVVSLLAGSDLSIAGQSLEINNRLVTAAVFELQDTAPGAPTESVFEKYAGPCGGRPESGSCGAPEPIEFFGGVGPDCCGTIVLELQGCAIASLSRDQTTLTLSCDLGLGDNCPDKADGTLPAGPGDDCTGMYDISDIVPIPPLPEPPPSLVPTPPQPTPDTHVPFCDDFENGTDYAQFIYPRGSYSLQPYAGPPSITAPPGGLDSYLQSGGNAWDIALWNVGGAGWTNYYKQVSVWFQVQLGNYGQYWNAGLLTNYRPVVGNPSFFEWWGVRLLDPSLDSFGGTNCQLQIVYFDGAQLNVLTEVTNAVGTGEWLQMNLFVVPPKNPSDPGASISCELKTVFGGAAGAISPLYIPNFAPGTGMFGIATQNFITNYDEFCAVAYNP